MFGLGMPELIVILGLGVLLFGNKLPDLARSLGRSVSEFRREMGGLSDEIDGPSR